MYVADMRAALLLAAAQVASAALLRHTAPASDLPPTSGRPIRQPLWNDEDVSFIGKITVGGQTLDVIPDTGSFELVVFSDQCMGCGNTESLFHASNTTRRGSLQAKQSYGSGSVMSQETYADVLVAGMQVEQQFFWQVMSADMPILRASTFQGIFGLGPPDSNTQMTYEEFRHGQEDVDEMKDQGINIAPYESVLQNLKDVHEFSKTEPFFLSTLGMRAFSVCLLPGSGQPGYFIYHDDSMERFPMQFTSVRNVGKLYWSTTMTQVKLGEQVLDCNGGVPCSAIMDTGTSLIAAPSDVVDMLEDIFERNNRNCENLSALPRLEFLLDGKQFSLPPHAYVGILEGDETGSALDVVPSLRPRRDLRLVQRSSTEPCSLLVMRMGSQEGEPREWIFGLPFFREYYTTFQLQNTSRTAESMHFAKANSDCEVGDARNLREPMRLLNSTGPLRVNARKLRPPRRWARRGLA